MPFGKALFERLGLSTLIESDANAITIGEHWFRRCRDLDDFVVVTVEHSLGLGVMHGGELFRGAKGISFNLGDLVMAPGGNGEMTVSRLADQAAEPAILAPVAGDPQFREAARLGHAMRLPRERIVAGDNALTASALRAGEALGLAIANLITLFAPPRVVIVGSTLVLGEHLMRGTSERARPHASRLARRRLGDRGRRGGRRHGLGARRGGGGAEGALRRALEHDRPGAAAHFTKRIRTRGTMKRVGVGVIGCGVISGAYLKAAQGISDPRYPRRSPTWCRRRRRRAPRSSG